MATYERTLTMEKRVARIVIGVAGNVTYEGHAVEVESEQVLWEASTDATGSLTTNQRRAVNDLLAAAAAWMETEDHPILGPPAP